MARPALPLLMESVLARCCCASALASYTSSELSFSPCTAQLRLWVRRPQGTGIRAGCIRPSGSVPLGVSREKALGHLHLPISSWYADPAEKELGCLPSGLTGCVWTIFCFPLGYGAFSLFPSSASPLSCTHLITEVPGVQPETASLACCLHKQLRCMTRALQCP